MTIYLDFDRTLFDTEKFIQDLEKLIIENNVDIKLFNEYKANYKKEGFNPEFILKEMEKDYSFNHDVYQKIDELLQLSYQYIYSDVVIFLNKCHDNNYQVCLLTKGNHDFQLKKIKYSHLEQLFNKVIITQKRKGELALDYSKGIFIDDNPYEIDSILDKKPFKVIRIAREKARYNDIATKKEVPIVQSLSEINFN